MLPIEPASSVVPEPVICFAFHVFCCNYPTIVPEIDLTFAKKYLVVAPAIALKFAKGGPKTSPKLT